MKRVVSFFLCLTISLGLFSVSVFAAEAEDELTRAAGLGIAAEKPTAGTVSAAEFFEMLDRVVKLTDASLLPAFQSLYPNARVSDAELSRYDGMVAVLAAAEVLGVAVLNVDSWYELHTQIGEKCWDSIYWNDALFGDDWGRAVDGMEWVRNACAYFYSFGRSSRYSAQTIFDYDAESNSMRTDAPFTYEEAARAAVRLHDSIESNFPVTDRVIGAEDQALLDAAQSRIDEILNSKTEVSYTGTAYYVSNSGKDDNDGLSPETAWATLTPVNQNGFESGDAVFFERGGLWRGIVYAQKGVTYSAYGEGAKPRIYGSPESGVGEEKWSLWYGKDGVKIWEYHTALQDPGGIVMNGGECYASRVYSLWNGEKAVFLDDPEREFDIVAALEHDLQFYCAYPDDIRTREIPFPAFDAEMHGTVYLRCDYGNPGTLYEQIEFQCPADPVGYCGIVQCNGNDCVIDNLCLMYSNTMGISTGLSENVTVQNCEVAFVGGGSHIIGFGQYVPVSGEGIRLDGYGNTGRDNYVHDCFDGGIIFEPDLQFELDDGDISEDMLAVRWGNICIEGNVIEQCNSGVLIGVHCEDDVQISQVYPLTIQDNDILYCGYGWSGDAHYDYTWGSDDYTGNSITFWDVDYAHDTYLVKNNRLYIAKAALIHMVFKGENVPVFSGNTYAQNLNAFLLYTNDERAFMATSAAYVLRGCRDKLGDSNADVVPFAGKIDGVTQGAESLTVRAASTEAAVIAVAGYDEHGKLLCLQTEELCGSGIWEFAIAEEMPATVQWKVFLFRADNKTPLCEVWTV